MNEKVIKVLNENMWSVVTMGEEPDVAPVAFKTVLPDGKLAIADVFLSTTLENIAENGMAVISAFNPNTLEGYKIYGKAKHLTEGKIMDSLSKVVTEWSKGNLKVKGVLIIEAEKIIETTPGASKNPL